MIGEHHEGIVRVTIIDRREIAFDAAAIAAVLVRSTQMAGRIGLPAGAPKSINFDAKAGALNLTYGDDDRASLVQPGPLSALLIAYCLRAKIKVPRHLARSIRVDQQAVALVFSETHLVPPESLLPERPEAPPRPTSWIEPQLQSRRPR
jgi:hypothetical protein